MVKIAYYGFILYERVEDLRIRHFRKASAKQYVVAEARIHDLVRSQRWSGTRVFEIWDGINAISKITCSRENDSKSVNFVVKDYLLTPKKGTREFIGYEQDLYEATKYKRTSKFGGSNDVNKWIADKPKEKVICQICDKTSWTKQEKLYNRSLKA